MTEGPLIKEGQILFGRSVIVTRARAQAGELASILESLGARVVYCPVIEITDPESYAPLDQAIDNLYGYDWLVLTSTNAVDFFVRRLKKLGFSTEMLDDIHVCAVGDSTADRLSEQSVHVDVVPTQFRSEGVFEALVSYLGDVDKLGGLNFLMPRAAVARDFLPKALEEAGARVDVVHAYRTVSAGAHERRRIEALLAGDGIDCITFTSGSTVSNFAKLFDTSDLSQLLDGVSIACIGSVTAAEAAKFGLECNILPKESTIAALANAVAEFFSGHSEGSGAE